MKFAVFAIVACLCICYAASLTETKWGNVHGRAFGVQTVEEQPELFEIQNKTFTFSDHVN